MKRVWLPLICVLSLFFLTACGTSADSDNCFRVGMECNYTPFNWTQSKMTDYSVEIEGGGYADGYDVQLAKKVADALGKKLIIVKTDWDGLIVSLTSGNIDAIIAGMTPTDERRATIDFTDPYWTSEYGMVVRKDSKYANAKTLSDFSNAVVTGQLNTTLYELLLQIPSGRRETAMESFPVMIVALQSGAIDGFINDIAGGTAIETANPDLCFVSFEQDNGFDYVIEETASAIGLRKGDSNYELINSVVNGLTNEERVEMMAEAIERQPLA